VVGTWSLRLCSYPEAEGNHVQRLFAVELLSLGQCGSLMALDLLMTTNFPVLLFDRVKEEILSSVEVSVRFKRIKVCHIPQTLTAL
jgi:hypothetical protein